MRASNRRLVSTSLGLRRFYFCFLLLLSHSVLAKTDEDDVIIILPESEESVPLTEEEERENILKDIKARSFIRADTSICGQYQLASPEERPIRLLGSTWISAGISPADYLSLQLSVIGRVPIDITWQRYLNEPQVRLDGFLDLYDSFLKLQFSNLSFYVGDLLIPWVSIRGAAILNRLNPVDYRRGPSFVNDISGRLPQLGAQFYTSLWEINIEGVYLFQYRPNQGSLLASDQGGVAIARYQGALVTDRSMMGSLSWLEDRSLLEASTLPFQTPTFAIQLKRQLGDIVDAGINFTWGYNEVPHLSLPDPESSFLAARYFGNLAAPPVADPDSKISLSHSRVVGVGADISMNLGAVVLKGEALVEPKVNETGGRTTLLVSQQGVKSKDLTALTLAAAVDGEYGDWFTGSIELFDTMWFNVPPGEYVLGVESLGANVNTLRSVHRLALGLAIDGGLFDQALAWRMKGEMGILQPDILATLDFHHQWQPLGLSLGAYANLFAGISGSPGWFRRSSSAFGVYIRHEL